MRRAVVVLVAVGWLLAGAVACSGGGDDGGGESFLSATDDDDGTRTEAAEGRSDRDDDRSDEDDDRSDEDDDRSDEDDDRSDDRGTGTNTRSGPTPAAPGDQTNSDDRAPLTIPGSAGDHGPQYFQLPSGNIGCYVEVTSARCDILERDWAPPPAPTSCDLDFGHAVYADRAGGRFVCAGDTVLGGPDVLAYGDYSQRGDMRCDSAETGVTCYARSTGRGFELARQAYRFF